jgi:LysM repeat protein
MRHQVCRGETLDSIAKRYGLSTAALRKINNLTENYLPVGKTILIKGEDDLADELGFYCAKKHQNWQQIAQLFGTTVSRLKSLNPNVSEPTENQRLRVKLTGLEKLPFSKPYKSALAQFYRVQSGESLSLIAKKFCLEESQLRALNSLSYDFAIYEGFRLQVSQVFFKVDKQNSPPDLYPAVFEGFSFDDLLFHRLQKGENFEQVAQKYGLSKQRLLALNFLKSDTSCFEGMKLWIQGQVLQDAIQPNIFYTCQRNDTAHSIALKFGLTRSELLKINSLPSNFEPYIGFEFRVKWAAKSSGRLLTRYPSKESLKDLATRFGLQVQEIIELNGLNSNPKDGQNLFLTLKSVPEQSDLSLHIVSQGQSLSLLCAEKRADENEVLAINSLKNNALRPGQWVFFPKLPHPPLQPQDVLLAQEILLSRPQIKVTEGQRVMGGALKSPVGRCSSNDWEDLTKLQQRLQELRLFPDGVENPLRIKNSIGKQPITSQHIPITISAIEEFQRRWLKTAKLPAALAPYRLGVVHPCDQTDFLLRQMVEIELPGGSKLSGWEQNLRHDSRIEINSLRSNALRSELWDILEATMPGRLDSLSTQPLRYGILGFKQENLLLLLAKMKLQAPIEFRAYLQKAGIDLEFRVKDHIISDLKPKYLDFSLSERSFEINSIENLDYYGLNALVEASSVPSLAFQQVLLAIEKVIMPALELSLDVELGKRVFKNQSIIELLYSQLGTCAVVDMVAHCGLKPTASAFKSAFESLSVQYKIINPSGLKSLETHEVLVWMKNAASQEPIRKRAQSLLENKRLESQKNTFYAFAQNLFEPSR